MSRHDVAVASKIIDNHVLRPYENLHHTEAWRDLPEVPTREEIMPLEIDSRSNFDGDTSWASYQNDAPYSTTLPHNLIQGPWPSKEEYISAHYKLLREDAVASLRSSVKYFRADPTAMDDRNTHIYTDVHVRGLVLGHNGIAFRIEFSTARAGMQIRWEQSKRLQQGTIVALSPMTDMFRTTCKVAVVAARPIEGGLDQDRPQIDIFWGDKNDAVIDPVGSYVMLEARSGYFESARHILVALQKLRTESFDLSRHLSDLDNDIRAPTWLEEHRLVDLSSLICPNSEVSQEQREELWNVDVVDGFPTVPSTMDSSQMAACERIVTKKISIVQGPPGTGKTFTSVAALRVLIDNLAPDDPPIIIAAQTNHALDQLLTYVLRFEAAPLLRLGGRSAKSNIELQTRTLYQLRLSTKEFKDGYTGMRGAKLAVDGLIEQVKLSLAPLLNENVLSSDTLFHEGIISEAQKDSLTEAGWGTGEEAGVNPIATWIGTEQLIAVPRAPEVNLGLPLEEEDPEYMQLQEVELDEDDTPGDRDADALKGDYIPFGHQLTGQCHTAISDRKVSKILAQAKDDLYKIPSGSRGAVYRYWEKKLSKLMLQRFQRVLAEYKSAVNTLRTIKVSLRRIFLIVLLIASSIPAHLLYSWCGETSLAVGSMIDRE
jgi:helicase required for RNAi-mediated heterochromatin assembly 1